MLYLLYIRFSLEQGVLVHDQMSSGMKVVWVRVSQSSDVEVIGRTPSVDQYIFWVLCDGILDSKIRYIIIL